MKIKDSEHYVNIIKETNEVLIETNRSMRLRIDFLTKQIQNRDESILHYKKLYEDCKDRNRSRAI